MVVPSWAWMISPRGTAVSEEWKAWVATTLTQPRSTPPPGLKPMPKFTARSWSSPSWTSRPRVWTAAPTGAPVLSEMGRGASDVVEVVVAGQDQVGGLDVLDVQGTGRVAVVLGPRVNEYGLALGGDELEKSVSQPAQATLGHGFLLALFSPPLRPGRSGRSGIVGAPLPASRSPPPCVSWRPSGRSSGGGWSGGRSTRDGA